MKKVTVIDGQGGRLGALLTEAIKAAGLPCELLAVGTNTIAATAMLKAGADAAATGENPVVVACRDSDVILGPVGILCADALLGEITKEECERFVREALRPEYFAMSIIDPKKDV